MNATPNNVFFTICVVIPTTNEVYKVTSAIKIKKSNNSWPLHLAPRGDHTRQQKYKRAGPNVIVPAAHNNSTNKQVLHHSSKTSPCHTERTQLNVQTAYQFSKAYEA
jgi:hypothetical protein